MLLTILIPTYNRLYIIPETIGHLHAEIARCADKDQIELLICDNASEDGSQVWLEENAVRYNFRYHLFEDHVGIDESFDRSANQAKADYVWVFGDDDLPIPGVLDRLISKLRTEDAPDFIFMNRLVIERDEKHGRFNLEKDIWFESQWFDFESFIERFVFSPGFITAVIVKKIIWEGSYDYSGVRGYGFLGKLYQNAQNGRFLYFGNPGVVQRLVENKRYTWGNQANVFNLFTMPRILCRLLDGPVCIKLLQRWAEVTLHSPKRCARLILSQRLFADFPRAKWDELLRYLPASYHQYAKIVIAIPTPMLRLLRLFIKLRTKWSQVSRS